MTTAIIFIMGLLLGHMVVLKTFNNIIITHLLFILTIIVGDVGDVVSCTYQPKLYATRVIP